MKTLVRSFAVVSASFVTPAHAVEPVAVSQDVVVEEAWARVDAAGATEIFLVVNNRSVVGAVLGIQIPAATEVKVINAAGRPIELSIPIHSELYMDPEGVRIVATGLSASSTVEVSVTIGNGDPVAVEAKILADDQAWPDHHDYDHG